MVPACGGTSIHPCSSDSVCSADVVLNQQREHAGVGVVSERGRAQLGEPVSLVVGHRVADWVVVESQHAAASAAHDRVARGAAQLQRVEYQRQRSVGERAERVVELGHRLAEAGQVARPAVARINGRERRVDEVEHLFVVALALGEFAVEVSERIVAVAHDGRAHAARRVEEAFGLAPRACEHIVEPVIREQEEAVVATCGVDGAQIGARRRRGVDGGHQSHAFRLPPQVKSRNLRRRLSVRFCREQSSAIGAGTS